MMTRAETLLQRAVRLRRTAWRLWQSYERCQTKASCAAFFSADYDATEAYIALAPNERTAFLARCRMECMLPEDTGRW